MIGTTFGHTLYPFKVSDGEGKKYTYTTIQEPLHEGMTWPARVQIRSYYPGDIKDLEHLAKGSIVTVTGECWGTVKEGKDAGKMFCNLTVSGRITVIEHARGEVAEEPAPPPAVRPVYATPKGLRAEPARPKEVDDDGSPVPF